MQLFSYRYYTSPDGDVWTETGESRDQTPDDVSILDYAKQLVSRLGAELPGDDGLRVRVWIGELTDDDTEAEIDLDFHWRDDVDSLLAHVEKSRSFVDRREEEVRHLEQELESARGALRQARKDLNLSVYHASRGGAAQTAIVGRSGHQRNWVRTTVRDVETALRT